MRHISPAQAHISSLSLPELITYLDNLHRQRFLMALADQAVPRINDVTKIIKLAHASLLNRVTELTKPTD